ncbi:hypothetical protein BKA66DRAFT_433641 [Pyrenochaeta sp. MPI-SDFR-AT-0127]|nr:hypothetical protein BKA66DRAFT_433641 [Pyrenochaeta sp. MPI-SDFR-AT-0127]
MSSLLRCARTTRAFGLPQRAPRPRQPSKTTSLGSNLGLVRSRFSSSNGGFTPGRHSQLQANKAVLYTLMGANVAVFGYAMYLKAQAAQGFPQPFIKFMQNMTLNLSDFRNGRWWTLLTANFTHVDIGHIFSNMFTLFFLGRFLAHAPQITPGRYLVIAVGSAVSGAAGYLCQQYWKFQANPRMSDHNRGLGFSGAVMGISSVAACMAPTSKVLIYGIVPLPLWAMVAGYAVYDGYYLNSADTRVGHAGHLGGLAFGMVYYLARLRGFRV